MSGRIPSSTQFHSFNELNFIENSQLFGDPLLKKCTVDKGKASSGHASMQDKEDEFITLEFYGTMAFGVVVGFFGSLLQ